MGIILGDFNIRDPEEGRFNVWNQIFTDGDPGKTAVFHSFHTSLRLPNLITREETPQPLVSYALFPGLIAFLSIYPWLKYEISIVILMSLRTWMKKTIPSDHAAVRFVIQKPSNRGHQSKPIP